MTESLDCVFYELPKASLDADTAVCFILDESLRLIYCNPAWDRFAVQNDGAHLLAANVLGSDVLKSTSGDLVDYYRSLYGKTLRDGQPRDHDFLCSSPVVERSLRMSVHPLRHARALLVACSFRLEKPHPASQEAIPGLYLNEHGFVIMCSNCRRTRRAGLSPEVWDWISDFVAHPPAIVSHGLCPLCLEYYYPVSA